MRLMAGTTIAALVATALVAAPAVADDEGGKAAERPAKVKVEKRTLAEAPITKAAGVIVKRGGEITSAAAREAVAKAVGADVSAPQSVTAAIAAYNTAHEMTVEEAKAAAAEVAKLPGVEWAEPNLIMHADTPWPTPVNDPLAGELPNVWDTRDADANEIRFQGVTPWPAGGYGVKSPAVWPQTRGAGVTVAVLDTGIRPDHPEFQGQLSQGFDFISDPTRSNDGDGRDADPADAGDWTPTSDSSWHGTHVAGTIAAATDNGQGIAGIAPGAKIQAVRVLGSGGGSSADIAAGIVWASGGSVPGVPANANPAKVLNMSLGGTFPSCPSVYGDAINAARSNGSSIIVSAGNNNSPASGATPANCAGVVTVGSLSPFGDKASYSNFGPEVEISAIGGEQNENIESDGVLSTLDSGTTTPVGPTYGYYQGTSMSAPAVAGGAAIIASLGPIGPDAMTAALQASTIPFPTSSNGNTLFQACDTARCGAGALDLTKLPIPTAAPSINSHVRIGESATSTTGGWAGAPTTPAVTWTIDGAVVGEGASYVPKEAEIGKGLVAFAHAAAPFASIGKASAPVTVDKAFSTLKLKGKRKVKPGTKTKFKVRVTAKGVETATGKIQIHVKKVRKHKIKGGKRNPKRWINAKLKNGKVTVTLPKLKKGKYKIKVLYKGSKVTERKRGEQRLNVRR